MFFWCLLHALCDLQELKHLNLSVFKRLESLLKDESRSYIFYPNEFSAETAVLRWGVGQYDSSSLWFVFYFVRTIYNVKYYVLHVLKRRFSFVISEFLWYFCIVRCSSFVVNYFLLFLLYSVSILYCYVSTFIILIVWCKMCSLIVQVRCTPYTSWQ